MIKSYKIIDEIAADYLKDTSYTIDDIEKISQYQFEFIKAYMRIPVKGRLYIPEFGAFEIKANALIAKLKGYIRAFREFKERGEPYPEDMVIKFRELWPLRITAARYIANKGKRKKGYYKPIDIIKNRLIPKKKKKI